MDEKIYTVPYGKGEISFDLPPGMRGAVIESKKVPPIAGVEAAIAEAEVWVSDLWSAQLKHLAQRHQICIPHQLRDLQYAIDADRCAFAYHLQRLFLRAKRLSERRDTLSAAHYHSRF